MVLFSAGHRCAPQIRLNSPSGILSPCKRRNPYDGACSALELYKLLVSQVGGGGYDTVIVFIQIHAREGNPDGSVIRDHWSGISMEALVDCARRARAKRRGGVLVLALGARKAPVIYECLRRGLISQLIVDSDLADALGRILTRLKLERGQ